MGSFLQVKVRGLGAGRAGLQISRAGLFTEVQERLTNIKPVGDRIAEQMRNGRGGVNDQFLQQRHESLRGVRKWKPSQRALGIESRLSSSKRGRRSLKTPTRRAKRGALTLVDTGAYRRAWLNRGAGAKTRKGTDRVTIGIDTVKFPHVLVFQGAVRLKHVAPRPLGVNKRMVDSVKGVILDYAVRGDT